jgi:toxin ParE1/3/4
MPRLRFSHDARADLREIARFIARDKPSAARKWVEKLKAKCRLAAQFPELGQMRKDLGRDIRCTFVGSYVIFYRHRGAILEIARVIRGDRDIRSI